MENLNVVYRTARIDAKGLEWIVLEDWRFVDCFVTGRYSHKNEKFSAQWVFFKDSATVENAQEAEAEAIKHAKKRSIESF